MAKKQSKESRASDDKVQLQPLGDRVVIEQAAPDQVYAEAWGTGARWAIGSVPDLLGASDDVSTFDPGEHPLVVESASGGGGGPSR